MKGIGLIADAFMRLVFVLCEIRLKNGVIAGKDAGSPPSGQGCPSGGVAIFQSYKQLVQNKSNIRVRYKPYPPNDT